MDFLAVNFVTHNYLRHLNNSSHISLLNGKEDYQKIEYINGEHGNKLFET